MIDHKNTAQWNTACHILSSTWICFSLGSTLKIHRLGMSSIMVELITIILLILIALLIRYLKHNLSLAGLAPILCLSTWTGALVEGTRIERDNQYLTLPQVMSALSSEIFGEAEIYDVRDQGSHTLVTILIDTFSTEIEQEQVLTKGLRVQVSLYEDSDGFVRGAKVFFRGQLNWKGGQRYPERQRHQEWMSRRHLYWQLKGTLFPVSHVRQINGFQLIRTAIHNQLKRLSKDRDRTLGVGLIQGMVLGQSSSLDPKLLKCMRDMGLGHLLAVSGLHIGICALLCIFISIRLSTFMGSTLPKLWGILGMLCGGWFYTGLAHFPLSAQRAMIMLSIWGIAYVIGRYLSTLTCLWLTAWCLTITCPSLAQEMGLQLSLMATLGLHSCLSLSALKNKFYRQKMHEIVDEDFHSFKMLKYVEVIKKTVSMSLKVAATSWLFTAPIFMWHLGEINLISLIYNTFLTPIMSLFYIPLALLGTVVSPLWSLPLEVLTYIGHLLGKTLLLQSTGSWGTLICSKNFAYPTLGLTCAYWIWHYARRLNPQVWGLYLLISDQALATEKMIDERCRRQRIHDLYRLIYGLLIVVSISMILMTCIAKPAQMIFVYVGQGDATLVRNGKGQYALFDVGPEFGVKELLRVLKREGVRHLDWVAISHLHPDHYGGLLELMYEIPIKKILYHGRGIELEKQRSAPKEVEFASKGYKKSLLTWTEVQGQIQSLNIPLLKPQTDVMIQWGGLQLRWIQPSLSVVLSENNVSLSVLIEGENERVLLSGDLEKAGESLLRRYWSEEGLGHKKLTIWQINHHGSRTSTTEESLSLFKPREAVLSLDGLHRFHFPHPEVVRRLSEHKIRQVRLDIDGHYAINM